MPVKGAKEYKKFQDDKFLTRKESILAQCYCCNGYESEDCLGLSCPLYQWSPYNKSAKFHPLRKQKPYPKAMIEANQRRKERG